MTSGLTLNSIMSKNPKVVGQQVDKEVVLILLEKNQVKVLNEVGGRIWELLNGERSIDDISTILVVEFEVEKHQAQDDALVFLEELFSKGIVLICP